MSPIFHKHPRLPDRDYTQGTYFVTFSSEQRGEVFGRIIGAGAHARMELNEAGQIVQECFKAIPEHYPHARIPEMQVMPDHLHAIVVLEGNVGAGVGNGDRPVGEDPTKSTQWVDGTGPSMTLGGRPKGPKRGSLGAIIAVFKSESTKRINTLCGTPGRRIWKKGYHEHVIREYNLEYCRISWRIRGNGSEGAAYLLPRTRPSLVMAHHLSMISATEGAVYRPHWVDIQRPDHRSQPANIGDS
jgi:putative transposase